MCTTMHGSELEFLSWAFNFKAKDLAARTSGTTVGDLFVLQLCLLKRAKSPAVHGLKTQKLFL